MSQEKILGVLAGGHMTIPSVTKWIETADLVVAADAGMLRVLEAGYIPDAVIGDFDSMPLEIVSVEMNSIVDRNQENTDCGKLLSYVESLGHSKVTLICAEGDLSDHFLDTIHCSVRSDLEVRLGLERGIAYILKGPVERTFPAVPGKRVSLLPLETLKNASVSGVQWSFESEELSVRGFTSISNIATDSMLSVSFDEGSAYLFIESESVDWESTSSV